MTNTALKDSSDMRFHPLILILCKELKITLFFKIIIKKIQTLIGHLENLQENDLAPPKRVDKFPEQGNWLVGSGNQRNA